MKSWQWTGEYVHIWCLPYEIAKRVTLRPSVCNDKLSESLIIHIKDVKITLLHKTQWLVLRDNGEIEIYGQGEWVERHGDSIPDPTTAPA